MRPVESVPELGWMLTAHGHRLHAPDPTQPWEQTLCGHTITRTGRNHSATPRCRYCCHLTGIPAGHGSPVDDPRARLHLGLPQGV